MLKWLFGRKARISDVVTLVLFIAEEAAFVSQKCTFEYCRARSGLNWDKLFKEVAFAEAVEVSRWRGFAAVLADIAVIAEGKLRPVAGDRDLSGPLTEVARRAFAHFPEARARAEIDWAAEVEALAARIAKARLAAPKPAHEVALVSGAVVFDSLPVHPTIRAYDRELVTNNIRFNLARSAITMDERFDPALADALARSAQAA